MVLQWVLLWLQVRGTWGWNIPDGLSSDGSWDDCVHFSVWPQDCPFVVSQSCMTTASYFVCLFIFVGDSFGWPRTQYYPKSQACSTVSASLASYLGLLGKLRVRANSYLSSFPLWGKRMNPWICTDPWKEGDARTELQEECPVGVHPWTLIATTGPVSSLDQSTVPLASRLQCCQKAPAVLAAPRPFYRKKQSQGRRAATERQNLSWNP